ncbi:Integrase core domain-containing protein, partial [[Lactobacillus] rogosae]
LIIHSDQGWQYQNAYYRNELKKRGIIQSMSRKGNCYDNCIMETFFGRLKNEMYYGCEKEYSSFEEFSIAIEEYIEYYNNKRIQAKTKWMPPVKYRIASMC